MWAKCSLLHIYTKSNKMQLYLVGGYIESSGSKKNFSTEF